ncbi:LOW QUALITY PROTEIN: acetylornithine aminotransferase [Geomicrobium sp. JCM 19055]|nr:LOW QUALITY PROTEIN: acetylornithine aminotransferase [Geomicrobium sp. JCM 19055]
MQNHLFNTYKRWDLTFEKAFDSTIIANGQPYLDLMSGIGTVNLGHNHQGVTNAIQEQLQKGMHGSNLFHYELQQQAADKLASLSGLDYVFFANSGAEANEAAIKLARKATGKHEIITCEQSFHGRTYGGMAATGQEKVRLGFGPDLPGFSYVPFIDVEAMKAKILEDTAAIMIEIVQGEGGVHEGTTEYLQAIERMAKDVGALLIIDEIQTGNGRVGAAFAYQQIPLSPDIVTTAKGVANGFPVGAMIGKKELADSFSYGSMAVHSVGTHWQWQRMRLMRMIIYLESVKEKGDLTLSLLQKGLGQNDAVKEIRGKGLMIGIELDLKSSDVVLELQKKNILALQAGEYVVRLLPPLTIDSTLLEEGIQTVIQTIQELSA